MSARRARAAAAALALVLAPAAAAEESTAPATSAAELAALIASGDYHTAAYRGRRALAADPGSGPLWHAVGEALFAVGRLDAAEDAYRRALAAADSAALPAELALARLHRHRGEDDAAAAAFRRLVAAYNEGRAQSSAELAAVARAAEELAVGEPALFHDAVRVYGEAIVANPGNLDARIALGELLLAKYNNTEALEVFRAALARRADYAPILVAVARSQHFDHAAEAMTTLEHALRLNPNLVPARALQARLLLEAERHDEAVAAAARALEVNPHSLEALVALAAAHFLRGDEAAFAATVARCLAVNPRHAELYNTLAEMAVQNRLYREAVGFAEQALALDARSWRGHGLLGLNRLRLGDMAGGRASLERAFAGDPFNVWIKNTLDLLDTLGEYESVRRGPFEAVLHRDEAAVLAPYVLDVAEAAYARLRERYGYAPPAPIRIELYPDHADFSVRTVGLAGIGLLGVSFGPVVALDSPSARPPGEFNWGSTLWHEIAHTFHLGMTGHRVPRWFSEGLAVYEEHTARPGWGDDASPGFLMAYRDGRLPPVSALSEAFVRPSYPEQVIHAYYLASQVFALIDARWGFDAIRAMLAGYAAGGATAEVMPAALGLSPAQFDAAFDAWFRERFGAAMAAMPAAGAGHGGGLAEAADSDYGRAMQAARQALAAGDEAAAEDHLRAAQALFPGYAAGDSAYWALAGLYQSQQRHAEAAAALEAMLAVNGEHVAAHQTLARLKEKLGDVAGAAEVLARVNYVEPLDAALHRRLAELYERAGDHRGAVRERAAVVALAPVDMAEARYRLARAQARAGEREAAWQEVLRSLEIAPTYARALELLLELRAAPAGDASAGGRRAPS